MASGALLSYTFFPTASASLFVVAVPILMCFAVGGWARAWGFSHSRLVQARPLDWVRDDSPCYISFFPLS